MGTLHQVVVVIGVGVVGRSTLTRQEWRPKDVLGGGGGGGGEKRGGVVVMNRCGQPYLASLLLLCGIRRTLSSLDDDAGHLANHFG